MGEDPARGVTRRHIAEIVESRANEIFGFVAKEIEAAGATNRLQAGLVLTGGGSGPTAATRAAPAPIGMSARVVPPTGLGGPGDRLSTPPYPAPSGPPLRGARHRPTGGALARA